MRTGIGSLSGAPDIDQTAFFFSEYAETKEKAIEIEQARKKEEARKYVIAFSLKKFWSPWGNTHGDFLSHKEAI